MARLRLAIAAAIFAAISAMAAAQGQSYESRGYGGPLYIGPNFKDGSQQSTPVYEPKAPKRRYRKRTRRVTKSQQKRVAKKTETAKATREKGGVKSENSSISRAADGRNGGSAKADAPAIQNENSGISAAKLRTGSTTKGAAPKNADCRKYFPTAGMTLSVPCG